MPIKIDAMIRRELEKPIFGITSQTFHQVTVDPTSLHIYLFNTYVSFLIYVQ